MSDQVLVERDMALTCGLLSACSLLCRVLCDLALGFLNSASDLVLDSGLAFDGLGLSHTTGSSLACSWLLGGAFLASGGLARRLSGYGLEDAGLGVASGCASGGHFERWVR